MAGLLQGKIALVTGGGSGIGRAASLRLAKEGAKIMIADYVPESAENTVKMIKEAGGEASCLAADVSVTRQVQMIVNKTIETYGRLDCAFNNAGIEGQFADTTQCSEENFDRVIAIDLKAVWLCMKYEIPQMLRQGGGAIVNTASIAGLLGFNRAPAYVAAKHGVVGLTRALALEFARRGVTVNAVCPGYTDTDIVRDSVARVVSKTGRTSEQALAEFVKSNPQGRLVAPDDVADSVAWLCSDSAGAVTGQAISVSGGEVM